MKEKAVNKQNYSPAFPGNINNYCYLVYVVNLTRMWYNNILLPLTLYQKSLSLLKMFKISGEIFDYGEDPLQSEPKRIKRSKNVVMKYPCDKCEYAATKASHLKHHIESKHERVRYPCDKCEYAATGASHLNDILRLHMKE